jgi:hypothetical protein
MLPIEAPKQVLVALREFILRVEKEIGASSSR